MKNEISIRAAVYLRAAELVEQGHCKSNICTDATGEPFIAHSPELWSEAIVSERAKNFCYRGAILRARYEITGEVPVYTDGWRDVGPHELVFWNNASTTTPTMVAAKLREQAFGD